MTDTFNLDEALDAITTLAWQMGGSPTNGKDHPHVGAIADWCDRIRADQRQRLDKLETIETLLTVAHAQAATRPPAPENRTITEGSRPTR